MPKSVTAPPDNAIDNSDDIDQMRMAAGAASALLKGVAHEDRLLLLCLLSRHELCVGEIETQLKIRQPSLSQQLGILRREKLVTTRREGKRIFYRIADQKALALVTLLYDLYCRIDH
ncbi:metalloregulator ArsR/SmtB family transcription factor [uncultured Porticoccus sp.]|uniref:metalloregulator ArsR/SmtB family transcription factor n=1 Tax=uncultured Porticoccus sp. TaxID=1256050 RepID=UPI0030DACCC4|tara:strand:- start:22058 stop:22408 length:351 start_codon:yes stop_codon:yes gene_type:complete